MRVVLTGATSLPGLALLDVLLLSGHEVRCVVRPGSTNVKRLAGRGVEILRADVLDAGALSHAFAGAEAVAHVAGVEYAPPVVEAMRRAEVERILAVSSTSAHSVYPSRSRPKREGERVVRESGLAWTIVRPTMVYGTELDRNMHLLLRFLDRSPVFPVFGGGENLWQPVYHEDLARGMLAALEREVALGKTYDLPGRRPLSYRDLLLTAARALGRRVHLVHVPLEPARRALALAERAKVPMPVKSEQVMRLREDKAYPYEAARRDLGYTPRTFEEGIALEVKRLREVGLVRR